MLGYFSSIRVGEILDTRNLFVNNMLSKCLVLFLRNILVHWSVVII